MPVFISYQHSQRLDAFILNERLLLEGIPTQLARYDDAACQTLDDICLSLRQYLADTTHLICVLSQEASEQWWVAWQLGAAAVSNRRISLYRSGRYPVICSAGRCCTSAIISTCSCAPTTTNAPSTGP